MAKKRAEEVKVDETLKQAESGDVLELDEVWSFVKTKAEKRWLWVALCRRTRQIVAYVIGDRSADTCLKLRQAIPPAYRACSTFSDTWDAYAKVFEPTQHTSVSKQSGHTYHIERWNNTLRQRLGRYVRKTLSFSKSDLYHRLITHWFICNYNISVAI